MERERKRDNTAWNGPPEREGGKDRVNDRKILYLLRALCSLYHEKAKSKETLSLTGRDYFHTKKTSHLHTGPSTKQVRVCKG